MHWIQVSVPVLQTICAQVGNLGAYVKNKIGRISQTTRCSRRQQLHILSKIHSMKRVIRGFRCLPACLRTKSACLRAVCQLSANQICLSAVYLPACLRTKSARLRAVYQPVCEPNLPVCELSASLSAK